MKQSDKVQSRAAAAKRDSISPRKSDFLVEEYRMLRMEIESYTKQKRQLEISVITAILIVYGFATTSELNNGLEYLVLNTPIAVVVWGIYRFYFYNKVIDKEVRYIKEKIEYILMGSEGGWEAFWEKTKVWDLLKRTEYTFWAIALLMTIAMPIVWPSLKTP